MIRFSPAMAAIPLRQSLSHHLAKRTSDFVSQHSRAGGCRFGMRDQDHVDRALEPMELVANRLSQPALDLIANHRVAHLFAHRQANAWLWMIATWEEDDEQRPPPDLPSPPLHTAVVRGSTQTRQTREGETVPR
jgi:hypothetical protein